MKFFLLTLTCALATFSAIADVIIIDDYVVSAAPIKSEEELLGHCLRYNKPGVRALSSKEFLNLRRHRELSLLKPLINTSEGRTYALDKRRQRIVKDIAHVLSSKPTYGICKGASNYTVADFKRRNTSEVVAKSFDLVGINLKGTMASEFKVNIQPKVNSNTDFRSFISAKLIKKYHPEAKKDNELNRYLKEQYNEAYELPEYTAMQNTEQVDIYQIRDKKGRVSSVLEREIYQRYADKLETMRVSYDAGTGRILMLEVEQYVDLLDRNLPAIAEQLSAKWGVKAYESRGGFSFYLNDQLSCSAKRGNIGLVDIARNRTSEDLLNITCKYAEPAEMLYREEKSVTKLVDDILANPPPAPQSSVLL